VNPEDLADSVLHAMRNRPEMLAKLHTSLENQRRFSRGLDIFLQAIEDGKTRPDQLIGMMKTMMKVQKNQAEALGQLIPFAMVYVLGETFVSDAAQVANKLGRGKEAVQHLFAEKFGHLKKGGS
jgi:hypothetical protein